MQRLEVSVLDGRTHGLSGAAPKRTEYQNLLWILMDWIPFFCQKAVFWIAVMRFLHH